MSANEDRVNPSGLPEEHIEKKATGETGRVLLETAIVDDADEQLAAANAASAKSTVGNMSDVPVEFISSYNTVCANRALIDQQPEDVNLDKLNSQKVQESLTTLFSDSCDIWSYAGEYDYSPQVPYNGFRQFLKVVFSYFDHLSLFVRLIKFHEVPLKEKQKLLERIDDFVDFLPLLMHQLEAVKLIRKCTSGKDGTNEPADHSSDVAIAQVTDASLSTELIIVHNEMQLTPKDMSIFFKKSVFGFWVPNSIRKITRKLKMGGICLIYPWTQTVPALFSEKKLNKLLGDYAVYWSYAEMEKIFKKMPKPKLTPEATAVTLNLQKRQYTWIVNKEASSVIENVVNESSISTTQAPIRLVILKPKLKQTDRVILQIHGGAWAAGSPEHSYTWLNRWVKEIGATIVAIDYSLAPAHKYPTALQEVLDTYLWLSDACKSATVLEPLGFVPQDIVVTGDSAGGNLTIALAILLGEITKKSSDPPKLPRALVPMYPAASPGMPFITASSTLFDVLLAPLQRSKMGIYYAREDPADPKTSYLNGKNNPWFADQVKYKDAYTRLNGHKRGDPLFHLVTYQSYDLLKQIPLYIQAAEFDPLLDDAVHLAKLWKGDVTFDVMPNAIHGYLVFDSLSPECKRASDQSLARLKQAIGK